MQIQRVSTTQTFTNKAKETNLKTKTLGWTLGALGVGGVGLASGYKVGLVYAEKNPDVVKVTKEIDSISTQIDKIYSSSASLVEQTEKKNVVLKDLTEKTNPIVGEVYAKVYETLQKVLELPIEYDTEKPNSVMLHDKSKALCERVMEVFKLDIMRRQSTRAEIKNITKNDEILSYLEELKLHYEKTSRYGLLHVENFADLIHSEKSEETVIAGMKSLLGDCSSEFFTTILFTSDCPEKLDKIAVAIHRTTWVDLAPHVDPKHRPILEELDKCQREMDVLQTKVGEVASKISDLESKRSSKEHDLNKLLTAQKIKCSLRGSLLGLFAGLSSVGLLYLLMKGNKDNK